MSYKVRIYYHDTDCGGVVYYANYLRYQEEARTDFFEKLGFSIKELADSGILFVVGRQEIEYKSPASYGQELLIDTRVSQISAARIFFDAEIKDSTAKIIVRSKTVLVCVDKNFKPQPIPDRIKEKIEKNVK